MSKTAGSRKYCVIMAGGVGSRFWPISRTSKPKQFLDILGTGKTFIRSTFERFRPVVPDSNFLVVTNTVYKDLVLEQIPELDEHQILCEPIGRNTAPCIAYAAYRLNNIDPQAEMIVTPSDHLILNEGKFVNAINSCLSFLSDHDALMTIGVKPLSPNTGYGYIQVDSDCKPAEEICKVKTFTEKPGLEMAKTFVESGEFFWNSGIFIWKAGTIIRELGKSLPDLNAQFASVASKIGTPGEKESIKAIYPQCKAVSIDVGVMERAENAYVYCSDFGWADIGTWGALYDQSPKDKDGNVLPSDYALFDTRNCIIKAPDGKLVLTEGLDNFIIVDTGDVLMICPRDHEQNIKRFTEEVKFKKGDKFI